MEVKVFDFDMKSMSNSLNSLSDYSRDAEEEDLVLSLLLDSNDEDNNVVIDAQMEEDCRLLAEQFKSKSFIRAILEYVSVLYGYLLNTIAPCNVGNQRAYFSLHSYSSPFMNPPYFGGPHSSVSKVTLFNIKVSLWL